MGYDFPMNLPDTSSPVGGGPGSATGSLDALQKRTVAGGGAITAGASSSNQNGNGSAGGHLGLAGGIAGDPSSQLMAYKNPGGTMTVNNNTTTVTGDYIDLNELLNLEGGGHEEDNSILI